MKSPLLPYIYHHIHRRVRVEGEVLTPSHQTDHLPPEGRCGMFLLLLHVFPPSGPIQYCSYCIGKYMCDDAHNASVRSNS